MNESEAIALERIAISARGLMLALLGQGGTVSGTLPGLRREIEALDKLRRETPPTAKEVIIKVISDDWGLELYSDHETMTGQEELAGDIHQALVEAGYL